MASVHKNGSSHKAMPRKKREVGSSPKPPKKRVAKSNKSASKGKATSRKKRVV